MYSVIVTSWQRSPNGRQICATVVSQECPCLAGLRGTSATCFVFVEMTECLPNGAMRSVVLCKIFIGLKGLNWNWVLFVRLTQTSWLALRVHFQRGVWIQFDSTPKALPSVLGRASAQGDVPFADPSGRWGKRNQFCFFLRYMEKKAKGSVEHVIHPEVTPNGPAGFHRTGYQYFLTHSHVSGEGCWSSRRRRYLPPLEKIKALGHMIGAT